MFHYQTTMETAIRILWVITSAMNSGTNHFHHLSILTPAIPQIIGVMAVGHIMLERPSPNWKARTADCLEIPIKSDRGAMIGILVTAWPEPDGMKKLRPVCTRNMAIAEIAPGRFESGMER